MRGSGVLLTSVRVSESVVTETAELCNYAAVRWLPEIRPPKHRLFTRQLCKRLRHEIAIKLAESVRGVSWKNACFKAFSKRCDPRPSV